MVNKRLCSNCGKVLVHSYLARAGARPALLNTPLVVAIRLQDKYALAAMGLGVTATRADTHTVRR